MNLMNNIILNNINHITINFLLDLTTKTYPININKIKRTSEAHIPYIGLNH